ncbi:MAG: hypothetical protein MUF42_08240 [Cytophagaceae bacterium]|jgi:HEAT repeat protein|nr:hypothetical protein [Cytophagaceae bacterium]
MTRIFKQLFNFEHGESKPFWILLVGGLMMMMGAICMDAAALSIYYEIREESNTIHLLIGSAAASFLVIQVFLSIQNRLPYYQSLLLVLSGISGYLFWAKLQTENVYWNRLLFVMALPVTVLSVQLFWNLAARLFDPIQLRKYSLRLEISALLGALVLYVLQWQFKMKGDGLLLLSFYSFLATLVFWAYMTIDFDNITEYTTDLLNIRFYNNFVSLIKDEYKRWLLVYSLVSGAMLGAIELFFLLIVSRQSETVEEYLSFFIGFSCITSLLGTVVGMVMHRFINDRYGYRITLWIFPVIGIIVGAIFTGFSFAKGFDSASNSYYLLFMLMVIVYGGYQIVSKAFELPTFRYYTLPLEQSLRSDIQTKLEALYRPLGKLGFYTLVLIVSWNFYQGFSAWTIAIPIFSLCLGLVVYFLHAAYRVRLKKNLGDETKGSSGGNQRYYSDELRELIPHLKAEKLKRHLYLLQTLDMLKFQSCVRDLATHEDNSIQRTAIREISSSYLTDAIPTLEKIQLSKYYAISPNKELIQRTLNKLKGAELRKKKVKYLEQLTISKIPSERSLGALLCTQSAEDTKGRLLGKLFLDMEAQVRKDAVVAASGTNHSELIQLLIDKLADPRFSNDAVAALAKSGEKILPVLESAFHLTGQEEKVQLKIVQIYGRIGTESASTLLLKKLNHNNKNIGAAALEALGHCKLQLTKEHELRFREELEQVCEVIVWNMSASLDLKHQKASDLVLNAMEAEIKENYDYLFKLLSLISDATSMYLVKKNIFSGDSEKADFAAELLDVLVAEELKPMLIPIITVGSYEEKIASMRDYFPAQEMSKKEVLFNLVQRDYKWVNRWTKACAMIELASLKDDKYEELFAANLVNPDMLLRETAALSMIQLEPALLDTYLERFRPEYNANHGNEIVSKVLLRELKEKGTSPALKFEIIRMLRTIPEFESIPGIILLEISRIMELERYRSKDVIDAFTKGSDINFYLVLSGSVQLQSPGMQPLTYTEGMLIHPMDLFQYNHPVTLIASDETMIYKIKKEKFFELISEHEEIPQSLLDAKAMHRKLEFVEEIHTLETAALN